MSDYKVTITCPECGKGFRFPIKENRIKFACPSCKKTFEAVQGKLVQEETSDTAPKQKPQKSQRFKKLFQNITTWKLLSIFFLVLSLTLVSIIYRNGTEKRAKNKTTLNFLNALKNQETNNFVRAKSFLTEDTKDLFSTFIESQYKYDDSLSVEMTNMFLNTLTALDYEERRIFSFKNIEGDTIHFYVDYELINDGYKLKVDIAEFIK